MLARPLPTPVLLHNCVNYFYFIEPEKAPERRLNMPNWERLPDGYLISVEILPSYSESDKQWWENTDHFLKTPGAMPSEWLPLELQQWMASNVRGMWMYEMRYRASDSPGYFIYPKQKAILFIFEKMVDAILFKLRWSDALVAAS